MPSGKTFNELSENEINYICTLKWEEVEEYLLRTHGRECLDGLAKRVYQKIDFLTKKYKVDFRDDEELI